MLLRDDYNLDAFYAAEIVLKRKCCTGLQYERLDATDCADQQGLSGSGTLNYNTLFNKQLLSFSLPHLASRFELFESV